jgi:hypothetical protein
MSAALDSKAGASGNLQMTDQLRKPQFTYANGLKNETRRIGSPSSQSARIRDGELLSSKAEGRITD